MSVAAGLIVLAIHGGAFVSGHPSSMDPYVADLRERGYAAKTVAYPLGSIPRALSAVRAEVEAQNRPVVLLGVSAGGTLAADLASKGEVVAAVVVAAPSDLVRWGPAPYWKLLGASLPQRAHYSPLRRITRRLAPQLILHGDRDSQVPFWQGRRYARASKLTQPQTKFIRMRGAGHEFPLGWMGAVDAWLRNVNEAP